MCVSATRTDSTAWSYASGRASAKTSEGLRARRVGVARLRGIARSSGLAAEQREELLGAPAHQLLVAPALDVQAQQRLRVRAAQIEAPVREVDAEAVGAVDRERARRVACLRLRDRGL